MLLCHSVTPPSITPWGFSRQRSLFYPSVNQHPQADSPGTSCQTTQHLPDRRFAVNASVFAWLRAPAALRTIRNQALHIRFQSDAVAVSLGGGFDLRRILLLSYKSNMSGLCFVCSCVGNLQEIGSEQIPFAVLIHLAKNDGSVRSTSL